MSAAESSELNSAPFKNKISITNLMNDEDVSPVKKQTEVPSKDSNKDDETDTDDEANEQKKLAVKNEEKGVEFNNVDFNYDDNDDDEEEEEDGDDEQEAENHDDSFKSEDFDLDDEEEDELQKEIESAKKPEQESVTTLNPPTAKIEVNEKESIPEVKDSETKEKLPNGEKKLSVRELSKKKKRSFSAEGENNETSNETNSTVKKAKKATPTVIKKEDQLSEKTSIEEDLLTLSKLSEQSNIKKKKEVPIWARKWIPKVKENLVSERLDTENSTADNNNNAPMPKPPQPYGLNADGIPMNFKSSYLNVEPDCDIIQAIQQWIYAQLVSIPIEDRNFVEIELKFGKLTGDNEVDRINLPISTETIYTNIDGHLLPTIDESLFKELIKHMITTTENNSDFNIMESEMIDSIYRINDFYNHKRPRFLRLSKDYKTGRIFEFIEKKNLSNLLIYTPRDAYDMKLSLNLEVPLDPKDEPPEKFANETPIHLRRKKRCSYIHNDSYTRFDLTEVVNKKQSAIGNESENNKIHNTFEVELELNPQVLVKCIDYISKDSTKYATLVRNFIQNGQLIRRKMTQLSGEIFQGKKKV